jgi:hypothetical protein
MRNTELKFVVWTDQGQSQKAQELQAAAVRSHVSRSQWSLRKRKRIAASTIRCRNSWSLAWEGIPQATPTQEASHEEKDPAPLTTDNAPEREVRGHHVQSPWHWSTGARSDAFNVVPAASGQQFELDLRKCCRLEAESPLTPF